MRGLRTSDIPGVAGVSRSNESQDVRQTERVPNPRTSQPDAIDAALSACADGNPELFAPVYDSLAPAAYGTALGVLRDPDHAAEVAQEVMVEVWQTAARFDSARGSARTWVVTLARRRAVDRVRSEQARRTRDQKDTDEKGAGGEYDMVAEHVEQRLEAAGVRRCLGSLTDTQRDAVMRAYYGDRTYREVAEDLGASLPTVKSRIRDGLIRLRNCLGVDHA